jgi:sialate O-acetylesterase
MKKLIIFFVVFLPCLMYAQLGLRLPAILSNHAVMQANTNEKLWGWATCTIPVKIVCSWNPIDTISVMPKKDYSWETTIKTPKPGGPYSITFFSAKQQITINDLLWAMYGFVLVNRICNLIIHGGIWMLAMYCKHAKTILFAFSK